MKHETKRDTGYAWVVLVAAYVSNLIFGSIMMSPAVYLVDWAQHFEVTKTEIGFAGALFASCMAFTGLLVSPLINHIGCRNTMFLGVLLTALGLILTSFANSLWWIYITYGLISGIGLGICVIPPMVIVQYYFDKRRGLASGISLAGHSSGTFLIIPIVRQLVEFYGWRGALFIHSGLLLNVLVAASLFRPPVLPELTDAKKEEIGKGTTNCSTNNTNSNCDGIITFFKNNWDVTLLTNTFYIRFLLAVLFCSLVADTMYKFTPIKAVTEGISRVNSSFLPSVIGLFSTISRIVMSVTADLPFINRSVVFGIAVVCMGIAAIVSCWAWNFATYVVCMAMFGLALGSGMTLLITVTVDLVGLSKVVHGSSFFMGVTGISMVISLGLAGSNPTCPSHMEKEEFARVWDSLGGYLADNYNYDYAYYLYGCGAIFGGLLHLTVPISQYISNKRNQKSSSSDNTTGKQTEVEENNLNNHHVQHDVTAKNRILHKLQREEEIMHASLESLTAI